MGIQALPRLRLLPSILPLLPFVVIFAAMNAFSEEMSFRAALLAPLDGKVTRQQSLLLTAFFFGIAHWDGMPNGVTGVLMSGVLGWLLGKSMLETRGYFWAWFIHFTQDIIVFAFVALGMIGR